MYFKKIFSCLILSVFVCSYSFGAIQNIELKNYQNQNLTINASLERHYYLTTDSNGDGYKDSYINPYDTNTAGNGANYYILRYDSVNTDAYVKLPEPHMLKKKNGTSWSNITLPDSNIFAIISPIFPSDLLIRAVSVKDQNTLLLQTPSTPNGDNKLELYVNHSIDYIGRTQNPGGTNSSDYYRETTGPFWTQLTHSAEPYGYFGTWGNVADLATKYTYNIYWCGDGETQNGSQGITYVGSPNEFCDDGGVAGGCKDDCSGYEVRCGDGQLDAGEECESSGTPSNPITPSNGCDASCKLVTYCSLSASTLVGPEPLDVTFNATKAGSWVSYQVLDFKDGQSQNSPSFSLQHTYTTQGTYSPLLTVRNDYNGGPFSSTANRVATCQTSPIVVSDNPISCDLSLSDNDITLGDTVSVNWNIIGNYTNSPQITVSPNSVTGIPHSVTNPSGTKGVIPQVVSDYTFSMTVSNGANTDTCMTTLKVNPLAGLVCPSNMTISPTSIYYQTPQTPLNLSRGTVMAGLSSVYLIGEGINQNVSSVNNYSINSYSNPSDNALNYILKLTRGTETKDCPFGVVSVSECGDGELDADEECDAGVNNNDNGACKTNCKLNIPGCSLTVNPNSLNAPLDVVFDATKSTWAIFTLFDYDYGTNLNNPSFPLNYKYLYPGTYNPVLWVKNNYAGLINGTLPTNSCTKPVYVLDYVGQCGDGELDAGEECESKLGTSTHIIKPNGACTNDCQLNNWCDLSVDPESGNVPLDVELGITVAGDWLWEDSTAFLKTYYLLEFGDGYQDDAPNVIEEHTYNSQGIFYPTATVYNNYDGPVADDSLRYGQCTGRVDVGGVSDVWIRKSLYSDDIVYHSGENITFRIDFGNSGSVDSVVDIRDTLPDEVLYLYSTIYNSDGTVMYPDRAYFADVWNVICKSNVKCIDDLLLYQKKCEDRYQGFKGPVELYRQNIVSCVQDLYIKSQKDIFTKPIEIKDLKNYKSSSVGQKLSKISSSWDSDIDSIGLREDFGYGNLSYSDHYFEYTNVSLPAGFSGYILVTVKVLESCNGNYFNTGFLQEIDGDDVFNDNAGFDCEALPSFLIDKIVRDADEPYGIGETITFDINFSNNANLSLTNVDVCDELPQSLDYESASISVNGTNLSLTPTINGNEICFNNLTMPPYSDGVMTVVAKVSSEGCENNGINTLNSGFLYNGDELSVRDQALYNCKTGVIVWKTQSVSGSVFTSATVDVYPMDMVSYRIDFLNVGSTDETVHVYDLLPDGFQYIDGSINIAGVNVFTGINGNHTFVDTTEFVLEPDQGGTLLITGQIVGNLDIVGNVYHNIARIGDLEDSVDLNLTGNLPILWLDKQLLEDRSYVAGQQVGFRVNFGNSGYSSANNITIVDTFPASLDLDSYQIFGGGDGVCSVNTVPSSQYQYGVSTITCNGVDLAPFSSGYILMTGTLYSNDCSSSINGAVIPGVVGDAVEFDCTALPYAHKYQNVTGVYTDSQVSVSLGSNISYKIVFANNGGEDTNGGVIVSDTLPEGVDYITSNIVVWQNGQNIVGTLPITYSASQIGGQWYIEYSGFDLKSLQTGHIEIQAKISQDRDFFTYVNDALIEFFGPYEDYESNDVVAVRDPSSDMLFSKNVIDENGNNLNGGGAVPTYLSGEEIMFQVVLQNNGDTVSNVLVSDVWPDSSCVDFGGWSGLGFTRLGADYTWNYGTMENGNFAVLLLTGLIVSDDSDCLGTHQNLVNLSFNLNGVNYTGQDTAIFKIVKTEIVIEKTADIDSVDLGELVTFYLNFRNSGTNNVQGFVVSDIWPGTMKVVPGLNYPRPFEYKGDIPLDEFRYTPTDDGRLLERVFDPDFVVEPGMSGLIILTGMLVDEFIPGTVGSHSYGGILTTGL